MKYIYYDCVELESGKYKQCEYARPVYDQDGHYDEVDCAYIRTDANDDGKTCPLLVVAKEGI